MRCPHCGEPVKPGQKVCFACGEKLRVRKLGRSIIDHRIIIAGGLLLLIGVIGVIAALGGRKKGSAEKPLRRVVQKSDSLKTAKRTDRRTSDTVPTAPADGSVVRAREQLTRIRTRYESIKKRFEQNPTPEQRTLMSKIERELGLIRTNVERLSSPLTASQRKEIEQDISSRQREVNTLISQLTRTGKSP